MHHSLREVLVRTLQDLQDLSIPHAIIGGLAVSARVEPGATSAGVVVDLLFASSGIEPAVVADAERLEVIRRTFVPVASVGHLIALKLLARSDDRPQDSADLIQLAAVATSDEIARARNAVRLIHQRGYARGRDLEGALDKLIQSHE